MTEIKPITDEERIAQGWRRGKNGGWLKPWMKGQPQPSRPGAGAPRYMTIEEVLPDKWQPISAVLRAPSINSTQWWRDLYDQSIERYRYSPRATELAIRELTALYLNVTAHEIEASEQETCPRCGQELRDDPLSPAPLTLGLRVLGWYHSDCLRVAWHQLVSDARRRLARVLARP